MESLPQSILVDTDILIDYLNGDFKVKDILDSPSFRVYYSMITKKELLGMPGISVAQRQRITRLLAKHRLLRPDNRIAEKFSQLLSQYANQGLRKADALVAATAWAKRLPLLTRNVRHYQYITEIHIIKGSETSELV